MTSEKNKLVICGEVQELQALREDARLKYPDVQIVAADSTHLEDGQALQDPKSPLNRLAFLFEHAPVALVLVDRARQVLCINRKAANLIGQVPEYVLGKMTGLAFSCPNAKLDPNGCGHSPHCGVCGLRKLIARSFDTGQEQEQNEIESEFSTPTGPEKRKLRVSSRLLTVETIICTLLAIEQIPEANDGLPGKNQVLLENP